VCWNLRRLPIESASVCSRERREDRYRACDYQCDYRDESADYRWIEFHLSA
jgi:hypothetical protein